MADAAANASPAAEAERKALDSYIKAQNVEEAVNEVLQCLLAERPKNPRQWLLNKLEQELSNESEDLSESDLHRLFAVTRKITAEIVPQDAIDTVINETLNLVSCDRVPLFVMDRKMDMLRLYASNLAQPIMVSPGQGIAGAVFNNQETVNIPNCYKDQRFDQSFDAKTGYVTTSLIAVPIIDFEGSAVGVLQAINKLPQDLPATKAEEGAEPVPTGKYAVPFERNDEKILQHLSQHVGIAMRNAEVYREAISTSDRATGLLNTIQSLSQDLGTQSMLLTITMHANKIVSSERCSVFLVDEPNQQLWSVSTDTGQEIRIPKKAGIVGTCVTEKEVINIPDAYADSRFNQEVDKKTGFKTQSILAIPMFEGALKATSRDIGGLTPAQKRNIYGRSQSMDNMVEDKDQTVIGVIQMINKVSYDGQLEIFDETDVEVMELFAKFVGPKLANSSMLAKRHIEDPDRKEAELALGHVSTTLHPGDAHGHGQGQERGNSKRHSHVMAIVEDNKEDEEEENNKGAATLAAAVSLRSPAV